jgi:YVTN family beta-propeller protein
MRIAGAFLALSLGTLLVGPAADAQWINYEGHQIHPLDLTPDGNRLLAVNTPDARLTIFTIDGSGNLSLQAEVPVGTEPVSVRARSNSEAWVVNHVSDTISIVQLSPGSERVKQTIKTDDEPSDVVFAGTGDNRAFVSISQRNRVDVYDAASPTSSPLFQVAIDGEDPRALARNVAGTEVYAAVFHSMNQTLIISGAEGPAIPAGSTRVTSAGSPYSGSIVPPPLGYSAGAPPFDTRPLTSTIVKWRDCVSGPQPEWCDDNDSSWNSLLGGESPIQIVDRDVAVIDADATPPGVTGYVTSVGTLNFGIAVNPDTGRLYVSNTDSRNHVRFERGLEILGDGMGDEDGICDDDEAQNLCLPALNGHLVDTRITVATGTTVDGTVNLNPHIDYDATPIASIDETLSIGQPNGMTFHSSGNTLYAAALLSRKVAVIDTSMVPGTLTARIDVGEGPTGVALNQPASRLYVLNRHENTISIVDTGTNSELSKVALYNPEPSVVTDGRKFMYDGQLTSGRGDVACVTCHPFANFDLLSWDLGDPQKTPPFDPRPPQSPPGGGAAAECGSNTDCVGLQNPYSCCTGPSTGTCPNQPGCGSFHPIKGPRTTQTLRGLGGTEPFHWHGDRASFNAFNVAFPGLLRNPAQLSPGDMQAFTNFIMTVEFPPNPNRNLDDSLSASALSGQTEFTSMTRDNPFECSDCHSLPTGTNGKFINALADQSSQAMKVPHLRNMYEKQGLLALNPNPLQPIPSGTRGGFGFTDEGQTDNLVTFLTLPVFSFDGNTTAIDDTIQFMMEFDTGQAAMVGHQITFDGTNNGDAQLSAELDTLQQALFDGKIDLVVKGVFGGIPRSFRCTAVSAIAANCQSDRAGEATIDSDTLKSMAAGNAELSFWAVPVGSGQRLGLDRDLDTFFDQDEIDAGSDPADPTSTPGSLAVPSLGPAGMGALVGLLFAAGTSGLRRRRPRS